MVKIHEKEINGDILAFLTGQEEVERAIQALENFNGHKGKDGCKYSQMSGERVNLQ